MWYKKGGELPAGKTKLENFNKALRISNVSEEDSGEYFCLASNKMGSIRHTISVRVKGTSSLPCRLLHLRDQRLRGRAGEGTLGFGAVSERGSGGFLRGLSLCCAQPYLLLVHADLKAV